MKVEIKNPLRCLKKDSTFEFQEGKLNIILGRNGSGKTTLLNAVRGYFEPESGNDWDLNTHDRKSLSKSISVDGGDDVVWFGLSKEDDPSTAIDAFTFVEQGGMSLKQLSQGEKFFKMFLNTAASAMALAKKGIRVGLILDEIDSHFDCYIQVKFIKTLSTLSYKYGITIIMTTHHFGVILGCENCLELRNSTFTKIKGGDYFAKLQDEALIN